LVPFGTESRGYSADRYANIDTVALIEQLASVYVEEDLLAETDNLHDSQTTENKTVEEVMEVM
jgi:hypothetical protein